MRIALAALFSLFVLSAAAPAQADPYRWCAQYGGGRGGGGENCYFVTLQQCRAAISGNGGFCRQNGFYDGRASTNGSGNSWQPRRRQDR
jgi:hypothetical protein